MNNRQYDTWKLDTPNYSDEYECDCCDFTGTEDQFHEVYDDGRQLWVCTSCYEEEKWK